LSTVNSPHGVDSVWYKMRTSLANRALDKNGKSIQTA